MLVLSRRLNETVVFPAIQATIRILGLKSGVVRVGIDAPREIAVVRGELEGTPTSAMAKRPPADVTSLRADKADRDFDEELENAGKGLGLVQLLLEAGKIRQSKELLALVRKNLESIRQPEARKVQTTPEKTPEGMHRCLKALVVEDDREQRELLAGFLRAAGLTIDTAGDGSDALDYLRSKGRPDVVLLDMTMPRCDGATTVRHIREDPAYAGLRIFAVTGSTPDQFNVALGPTGIDRWFQKPINPSELLDNLNQELCEI
ncbi:MAG: response regulator [Gemmataceae bacterium]